MRVENYVEAFVPEDEVLIDARARSAELDVRPVSAATGAALRLLTSVSRARGVVEVGTGAGISGLHLLRGMPADGVLTSIEHDPELQRAARKTFVRAELPSGRTRLIMGRALEVLPRLTDGGYDLVFLDATKIEYPSYLTEGVRLLRPGGLIAFHDVLDDGHAPEPTRRDADAVALRELTKAVQADAELVPSLLPVGAGLLVAAKIAEQTGAPPASRYH
ncbi:putative O-methyltransferase YrrM [Tamaricihabitans halophyticus]|uniref:Putative O-methyltransferase YrrM n=1 Tax=Tamaricihabitans halophyticus TaxID=1262583 RepID=A0A4R2R0Q3_9PSEU|nr:O-methyltransferase [Tamaricihabitans halophyticus]TCP56220.1 putative O-methyltransferase YrrM [Tamaricihabitans halophyticus]